MASPRVEGGVGTTRRGIEVNVDQRKYLMPKSLRALLTNAAIMASLVELDFFIAFNMAAVFCSLIVV